MSNTAWQPIESAPRDGTIFIIARDNSGAHPYSGIALWKSGHFRDPTDLPSRYWNEATHWQPIPAPPDNSLTDPSTMPLEDRE